MSTLSDDKTIERLTATLTAGSGLARAFEATPRATLRPPPFVGGDRTAAMPASDFRVSTVESLRVLGASPELRVRLEHTLGEGGMGVVRLGTQTSLERKVAVKTLRDQARDDQAALQLLREAWIAGSLEHPNVVPIYDVGLDERGAPVIVMKRIEGARWSDLVANPDEVSRRFGTDDPLEWQLRILVSVSNAISFAHSRGVIHRDMKPENVMIGGFGEVYLLDWGIAVSTRDDGSGRLPLARDVRHLAGTPSYMAPEMLDPGSAPISERTDVYLLGATLYEVFARRPPHEGQSFQQLVASIVVSEPTFEAGFPVEARAICRKALHRDPAQRYESVEAFRAAIEAYLKHRGSRRIAHDAKRSLAALLEVLERVPPTPGAETETRALAIYNLLGECRFGYRAALDAWPDNQGARRGLDRSLEAVARYELREGDPRAAAALVREMRETPDGLPAQVEEAVRSREAEEARLKQLAQDLDPSVGSRTRTFIGSVFGLIWTVAPLWGWYRTSWLGAVPTHDSILVPTAAFLVLSLAFGLWARETLTKTALNRRLALTLGGLLVAQLGLAMGARVAGIEPRQAQLIEVLLWTLTLALLAIHVERWFAISAAFDLVAFLLAARWPAALYPLMSLANLVLTVTLVRFWFPRQDLAALEARRAEIEGTLRAWRAGRGALFERRSRRSSRPSRPSDG